MSLSQLIEKRRQAQELQDVQQRQAPMRGNAEFAAGARDEHDLQKQEELRERQYREHNLGKGVVTAAEIDTWHEKRSQDQAQQKQLDPKAERDWEASVSRSQSAPVQNKGEMKMEKASSLPNITEERFLSQPAPTQEQDQRRRMSR